MHPLPPRPPSIALALPSTTPRLSSLVPNPALPLDPTQQDADIRHFTYMRRRRLSNSLLLHIISGSETFKVPIDVFRAASSKASLIDHSDPAVPKFVLIALHPSPIRHFLGWLEDIWTLPQAPYLEILHDMKKDLAVVRVGKMLGMDRYVQDIFNFYWRKLKRDELTYADIDVVLSLTVSKQDSFFVCIAERLAFMQYSGWKWHGFGDFDAWVTHRPWLREVIGIKLEELRATER